MQYESMFDVPPGTRIIRSATALNCTVQYKQPTGRTTNIPTGIVQYGTQLKINKISRNIAKRRNDKAGVSTIMPLAKGFPIAPVVSVLDEKGNNTAPNLNCKTERNL